jgi:hypothetical protein
MVLLRNAWDSRRNRLCRRLLPVSGGILVLAPQQSMLQCMRRAIIHGNLFAARKNIEALR